MATIVLVSAGGAPGVTTTALGLALTWPRDVLLADCDRHPNQAVLAGYLRGLPAGGRGLSALAEAFRADELGRPARLSEQTVLLDANASPSRRFLPGFTHPRSGVLFDPYWPRLAALFADLADQQTDVLVDWGRLDANGLPDALLATADAVLVVTRSGLPALAALRLAMPDLRESLASRTAESWLLVVGGGRPYSAREIADHLQVPLLGDLPWDVSTAEVFSDGAEPPRKLAARPLWRGYQAVGSVLDRRVAPPLMSVLPGGAR